MIRDQLDVQETSIPGLCSLWGYGCYLGDLNLSSNIKRNALPRCLILKDYYHQSESRSRIIQELSEADRPGYSDNVHSLVGIAATYR